MHKFKWHFRLNLVFAFWVISFGLAQNSFQKHSINNSFDKMAGIYVADLDGDGDNDLIGASINNNSVAWWRNLGGDPLKWERHLIDEHFGGAIYVFATDVDRDGDNDVLATAAAAGVVAWWRNDGSEPIQWTKYEIGYFFTNAHGIYAGDLDGDADIDVLATSADLNKISWWENQDSSGNGTSWQEFIIDDQFKGTQTVCAADIDNDSDLDVIGGASGDNEIAWWRNDGGHPLTWTKQTIARGFNVAHWVYAADIDRDGLQDVLGVAFSNDEIAWWRNNGGEPIQWTKQTIDNNFDGVLTVVATDMDADGDPDVLATAWGADEVAWWRNNGGSPISWEKQLIDSNFNGAWPIFAADLDGDTDLDLVAAGDVLNGPGPSAEMTWWENDLYQFGFGAEPITGHAPMTVHFNDLSRPDNLITSWAWDFDNNGTIDSKSKTASWTYEQPGHYTVALTIGNDFLTQQLARENYIRIFDGESALLFAHQNECGICSATDKLNFTTEMTLETWIKPDGWGTFPTSGFGRMLDKKNFSLYLVGSARNYNEHSLNFKITHPNGSSTTSNTPVNSIALEQWQYIAATFQDTIVKIYINGVEQPLTQSRPPAAGIKDNLTQDLYLGNDSNLKYAFQGALDEVRLWNCCLPPADIQHLMTHQLKGDEKGLVAYWKMNEGNGDSLHDQTGNGHLARVTAPDWTEGLHLTPPAAVKKNSSVDEPPTVIVLRSNFPNPFNTGTMIQYELKRSAWVQIAIYDLAGKWVKTLLQTTQKAGQYQFEWDGTNEQQQKVGSGIYFCRVITEKFNQTRKMIVVR